MLASAALALALAGPQDAPLERTGAHYRIVSHLPGEALADEALAAAEAAWGLALKELGLKEKKPSAPLAIHLYLDVASYEAADQELTGGSFRANLSFAHFDTKSGHVALQPPCSAQTLAQLGLPTLTLFAVAHEAAHLARYAHAPNALDHLEWFAEGLANHVALTALVGLGRMVAGLAEPLASRALVLCKQLLKQGKLPEAPLVMNGEIGDLEFYPRYAVDQRFYGFLRAKHGKDLDRMAEAMRAQGGGEAFRAGILAAFAKVWKGKELERLQQEWLADVRQNEPEWDETYRSLETRGKEGEHYVQRAFASSNAVAFRNQGPPSVPYTAAGIVRAVPGDAHQLNFLLGRTEKGFLSVAFSFPHGVSVFRCDVGATDTWTILGEGPVEGLRIGADTPFRIEASAEELVLFVNEAEALRAPLHGRSPLGAWGLGAQAKTTGEWKSIAVRSM